MGKDKKLKKGKPLEDFGEEEVEKTDLIEDKTGNAKRGKKGKPRDLDDGDEDIAPTKKESKLKKKAIIDEESEVASDKNKDNTAETKKGKKGKGKKQDAESEGENDEEPAKLSKGKKTKVKKYENSIESEEEAEKPVKGKTEKVKPKGKKSKQASSEEEEDNSQSVQSTMKASKSVFELLEVEDMDMDDQDEPDEEPVKEEVEEKKGKKSKKKERKKKHDDDEEDLDKMMEELALEIQGKKADPVKESTPVSTPIDETTSSEAAVGKKKKGKKSKETADSVPSVAPPVKSETVEIVEDGEVGEVMEEDGGTVKTAAQKRKEKKERDRLKKLNQNVVEKPKKEKALVQEPIPEEKEATPAPNESKEDDDKSKKKKTKGKLTAEEEKVDKKRPGKKAVLAMQEALKKVKEEEERLRQEEIEKELAAQRAEEARLEKLRLEQERKDKKKQKEKEKKERLKAEGKLLTKAQKQARARMEATLSAFRQQGVEVPQIGEKKERAPRLGDRKKPPKKQDGEITPATTPGDEVPPEIVPQVKVEIVDPDSSSKESSPEVEVKESWDQDEVKETWDASSGGEDDKESKTIPKVPAVQKAKVAVATPAPPKVSAQPVAKEESEEDEDEDDDEDDESSEEESSSEEDSSDESDDEEDKKMRQEEKIKEKIYQRIQRRKEEAEKNRTLSKLRSPVVCVLGHVDTGKTKILDKIRNTHVQDGEAGGITQQIGATMVPQFALRDQCKMVKNFVNLDLKLPGLLIIDTPGHESFSNLRSRGSSLCDIAVLVVDIMHGLEPQTIESLNMLKQRKTPFIVALNKVDRLYEWKANKNKDIQDVIRSQQRNTKMEFEERTKEVILQFNEQGLNAALCYENQDQRSYVSLVPTSAASGDGMGNLLGLVVELSQALLAKRLAFSEELQATVLEVKAIPGLGTTIDVILVNGRLREGDTAILAGHEGPVVTQIRSLLMPQPLKELRVKNPYQEFKEVEAAQGIKIAGKDLDKAIAGLQLLVAQHPDEVEYLKDEVASTLKEAMNAIKLSERGVYVQASTLGSLEALLEFLRTSKIPYSGIRIGPVVKKDVMKASIMLEHDNQYAAILAFDVKVERDAQELADSLGVRIFQANIIYHLFDAFMAYRDELQAKRRNEFKHIAVFPCKLRILPQFIFNSRDPIVVGVSVEAGVVKEGTPLCVPSRENLEIGTVTTIEINHKAVETARKGQEVCIKIEPLGGEAPKMFGRHFDHTDIVVSKITRQSIDACKEYFRDDLQKTDWQLMVELKKMFQIL